MVGMLNVPWRAALQPASFRGAIFKVETDSQLGGRRNAVHEFPERDVPWTEDMGRRARRWQITGYLVCSPTNPDYRPDRDFLIQQLEAGGPGTLTHPTLGFMQACCDTYSVTETRERGGMATFEMAFVEAGDINGLASAVTADTQAAAASAAANLGSVSAARLDAVTQSSPAGTIAT